MSESIWPRLYEPPDEQDDEMNDVRDGGGEKPDFRSRTWWLNVITVVIAGLTILRQLLGGGGEPSPPEAVGHGHAETFVANCGWCLLFVSGIGNLVLRYLTDRGIVPFWK